MAPLASTSAGHGFRPLRVRPAERPARPRRPHAGRRSLGAWTAATLLALLAAAFVASPASAVVTTVPYEGSSTTVGLQPRSTSLDSPGAPWRTFANPEGHPVMHSSAVYAIYWDPEYLYHGDWEHLIDTFLQSAGSESGSLAQVFSVDEQYTDKTNSPAAYKMTFRGAYTDTDPYPTSGNCVDPDMTDPEGHELAKFIAANKLSTGMGTIFYLLTPPGVTVCADGGTTSGHCSDYAWRLASKPATPGEEEPSPESYAHSFCSYHAAIAKEPVEGDQSTILYAAIPWSAGGAGDYHLFEQAPAFDCQDGGLDPSSKPKIEEPEPVPHEEEPNQLGGEARGPDGSFDTGLADLIVNQIAVEQQNTVTDPLLDAWKDNAGYEAVDECRNQFALVSGGDSTEVEDTHAGTLYNQVSAGHHYYLNDALNLASIEQGYPGIGCLPGARLEPQFTVPDAVNAGDIAGFDASESNITLDAGHGYPAKGGSPYKTYPTYTWDFGDGTKTVSPYPPGAAQVDEPSAFHSYAYGGTYLVTLTVTDVGGNSASFSQRVNVIGPAPPSPIPPATTHTSTATSAAPIQSSPAPAAKSKPASSAPKGTPRPSLSVRFGSHSLASALRDGLNVGYTVNEQVAGNVEVLLAKSVAQHVGIRRPAAKHLPKGYPRSVVIGSAVLVTTRRGRGDLKIVLPKDVSERLVGLSRVKLTLRIVVRNAVRGHPQTRTLLDKVILKG